MANLVIQKFKSAKLNNRIFWHTFTLLLLYVLIKDYINLLY